MTAIVPAGNLRALDQMDPAVREAAVTSYLEHARDQLTLAVNLSGPEAVAAIKAEIATAAEATKQLGLSKEIQTDAQEMVRRAEYALGKAIRAGQERGEIRTRGETVHSWDRWSGEARQTGNSIKAAPTDFATDSELSGADANGIYAMVDDVPPPVFDAALADAKAEGNVSRANVVRKIKGVKSDGLTPVEKLVKIRELAPTGMTSDQIAREIGTGEDYVRRTAKSAGISIPADKVMRGTRRLDHTKFVNETVAALEGLSSGLDVLDLHQVDRTQITYWSTSLTESLRSLNRLAKQIKEMDQ